MLVGMPGVLSVFAALSSSASAATISVPCSGPAALVGAINQANAVRGATISLAAGCIYTLNAVDNNWFGPNGLPAIASPITIEGNGATGAYLMVKGNTNLGGNGTINGGVLTLGNFSFQGGGANGGFVYNPNVIPPPVSITGLVKVVTYAEY